MSATGGFFSILWFSYSWHPSPPPTLIDISCLEGAAAGSSHFQKTWGRPPPAAPRIPVKYTSLVIESVADPWNFGTDPPLTNGSGSVSDLSDLQDVNKK